MYPEIVIAGCGNLVYADDGFGPAVAQRLAGFPIPMHVKVIDAGVCGPDYIFSLLDPEKTKHLIIIDCADFGGEPGNVAVFHISEDLSLLSDKDPGGIMASLSLVDPRIKITLIGCQPKVVDEMMIGLSDEVFDATLQTVRIIIDMIQADGHRAGICHLPWIG